jgi:hypothetical protein
MSRQRPRLEIKFQFHFLLLKLYKKVKLEYLDVTVLRRGVGEVRVVAGRAPACWQVWRGMHYKEECFYN